MHMSPAAPVCPLARLVQVVSKLMQYSASQKTRAISAVRTHTQPSSSESYYFSGPCRIIRVSSSSSEESPITSESFEAIVVAEDKKP